MVASSPHARDAKKVVPRKIAPAINFVVLFVAIALSS